MASSSIARATAPPSITSDSCCISMLFMMVPASHMEAGGRRPVRAMIEDLPVPLMHQSAILLLLALPVASVAWTVTHEEVFREPREFCKRKSEQAAAVSKRKFFYLFTCEYCFSHYVAALALWLFRFKMLYAGWRGYLVAWLALVWIAN